MNINRHNCEAIFLDYYEKKLNPVEVAELLCFLEENPDLKDLFENYEEIQAIDETIRYEDKEALKRKYLPEELEQILSSDIDKSNCEYFFVANAEGILSAEKLKQLNAFLEKYPEYKKEQELFLKCRLSGNEVSFMEKETLKRTGITRENKEEYFIRSIDKELNRAEEEQLALFLSQNPQLKNEYALFAKAKLPLETVEFENKEALKKQKRKPVIIPLFYQRAMYYAAAASVLLLVGLFFFYKEGTPVMNAGLAAKENTSNVTNETSFNVQSKINSIPSFKKPVTETLNNSNAAVIISSSKTVHIADQTVEPNTLASNDKHIDIVEETLSPFFVEDETHLLADAEKTTISLTQEEEVIALSNSQDVKNTNTTSALTAQASYTDDYQTIGAFTRKKVKKALGIDKASPCQPDDKISMWDVVVAAKNGIQKITGSKSIEVNKICNDEVGKVEYIFAAGNLRITRSSSK